MIYPLSTPQLEYLILSVLCKRDSYGYEISQQLKTVTNTKDSTLYPILKRLQGMISSIRGATGDITRLRRRAGVSVSILKMSGAFM